MDGEVKTGIKVALCQTNIVWEEKQKNISNAEKQIAEAAGSGAELILFPEMSFTGFSMEIGKTKEADLETVRRMEELAIGHGAAIGFGWVKALGDLGENHYTVVSKDGSVALDYVKIHSFQYGGEGEQFAPGDQLHSFALNGLCFTPLICYDLRFPEVFRMKMDETDAYIIPANWPSSRREHWNALLKARAIENQSYVLGVNCVGEIGGISYRGDTCAIHPNGKTIGSLSGKEGIVYADLEKEALSIREEFPVRKDRRPDLYDR